MTLHHLALSVLDLDESQKFYDIILLPLGYSLTTKNDYILVYDKKEECEILLYKSNPDTSNNAHQLYQPGFHHLALRVVKPSQIDEIHTRIVDAFGDKCVLNAPAHYPEYPGKQYYAVFFQDPSHLKIEIMFQSFE